MNENETSQIPANQPSMLPGVHKQTWLWIALIAAAIIVFGIVLYYVFLPESAMGPTGAVPAKGENLSLIQGELNAVDLNNLDSDLNSIDQELKAK